MKELEGCKPVLFFKWFEKISQIPRPSFHEENIADFLVEFAEERGLAYERDAIHNVLIRVPASEGYENVPPFLLQSHTDMVCAVDEGVEFDFLRDPIKLRVVGNELRATGTTLGMDDGGGMAAMLSFVDDPAVKHPELELLFTVQEEDGMGGAKGFDLSRIKSRRMINFDSGRTHHICVSSAGSRQFIVETELPMEAADGAVLQIQVRDGMGGHGGLDIHKNRACAANVMGELLHMLAKEVPVRLSTLQTFNSAIIPRCAAEIVVPAAQQEKAESILKQTFADIYSRYAVTDPNVRMEITPAEGTGKALTEADTCRVKNLLLLLPTGIRKCDGGEQTIVLGSAAILKAVLTPDGSLVFQYTARAVEDSVRDYYGEIIGETLRLLGFGWRIGKLYYGWPMKPGSPIVALFDRKHEEVFGYLPGHRFVHGGIEVSFITRMLPDMDAIAVNLPMANAHTTNKLLYIDQVPDFWALLTAVLADKGE